MAKSQSPAELKAAKAEAKATRKAQSKQRRTQLWQAFQMQRKEDARLDHNQSELSAAFQGAIPAAVIPPPPR